MRKELEKKLQELETKRFYIEMIDRWKPCDREDWDNVNAEISKVKKALKELAE